VFQEFSPSRRISPQSAALSLVVHAAVASLLIAIFAAPQSPLRPRAIQITLVAPTLNPPPHHAEPRRQQPPPPQPRIQSDPPAAPSPSRKFAELPKPAPKPRPMIEAPPEAPHMQAPAPELARTAPVIPPPVITGTFEAQAAPVPQSSAPQVIVKAAGFAATGTQASILPRGTLTASVGGFDTSSARESIPRRGSLSTGAGSGFGDAQTSSGATAPPRAAATRGSFGDVAAAAPVAHTRTVADAGLTQAAEILDKPRPVYTEEARRLSIEGEVLLEVLFQASGQIQVERLVRGLGHGLDESAMTAARQIHFRPARRDGTPVDSRAVVHISFQLAY
jgi:TonB family protein